MSSGRSLGTGLQPERTTLAWQRVGLAFLGFGLALPRLAWPLAEAWSLLPAGLVVTGAWLLLADARRRYLRARHAGAGTAATPDGRQPLLAAATALLLALVALALVLLPAAR